MTLIVGPLKQHFRNHTTCLPDGSCSYQITEPRLAPVDFSQGQMTFMYTKARYLMCMFFSLNIHDEPVSKDQILQPPTGFHPLRARLLTRLICVRLDEQVQLLAHGSKLLLQPA